MLRKLSFFSFGLLFMPYVSAPAQALPPAQAPHYAYIFAYPGSTCPGGSVKYKGPEQALAAESGAVYCRFDKKVKIVQKSSGNAACPPGSAPYNDPKAKPDSDVIWCK